MTNKVPVRAFCSNTLFRSEKFAVVKCSAKWRDFFACKTVCSFHRGSIRSKNSAPPSTNVNCSGSSAFIVSTLLNHLRFFAEKLWALQHCILASIAPILDFLTGLGDLVRLQKINRQSSKLRRLL